MWVGLDDFFLVGEKKIIFGIQNVNHHAIQLNFLRLL